MSTLTPAASMPALRSIDASTLESLKERIRHALAKHDAIPGRNAPTYATDTTPLARAAESGSISAAELARTIDHTLLKSDATTSEFEKLCREARDHGFATVCVNSSRIPLVARLLQGSNSFPIAVVGFPLGVAAPAAKAFETRWSIDAGAREIDTVQPVGALKEQDYATVYDDIRAVVDAAGAIPVKVILETSLLTRSEKIAACVIAQMAGAAFVKTSTGFAGGGATAEDIGLMRAVVGPSMGVKASGGVRTRADALKMIAAGADRLGASAGVAIVTTNGPATGSGY